MKKYAFWELNDAVGAHPALLVAATGQTISYDQLRQLRDSFRSQMQERRGLCVIEAVPTPECIAAYLAALAAECPVILREPMSTDRGGRPAEIFPILYRFDSATSQIVSNTDAEDLALHPDLRLLLSTSGSTGASKFVRLSTKNLTSNASAIAEYLGITSDDRAPTSLPLSYSYGMSVLNSHLQAGACIILVDESVVSTAFWRAFDTAKCTSFAGVPQSFYLLTRSGELKRDRPSLRYVTQAGGKLQPDTVRNLSDLGKQSGWRFYVMYGQTEAAPRIAYLPPELASEHPDAIGRAIPGGKLWVAGPDGTELPSGENGELIYEGPNVMMGYAMTPEDLSAGHGPPVLKTGDLGFVDEIGLFHITGRASRFLKLSGKRISLDEVETLLSREGIQAIAVGEDDALGLVHANKTDLASGMATKLSIPATFVHDIHVDKIPINNNGKPDLPAAKAMFESELKKLSNAPTRSNFQTSETAEKSVYEVFKRQFPDATITSQTSFETLGGTSNDFIEVELALESIGIPPSDSWHLNSIADLAKRAGTVPEISRRWMPDYACAGAIGTLLVVLLHVIGLPGGGGLGLPDDSAWHAFNAFFDPLRMPLFALLSGFSFYLAGTSDLPIATMSGRILRGLLVPAAIAIAVFAAFRHVASPQFAFHSVSDVLALLWLPYGHFWFVMSIILIMMASYAVFRLAPAKPELFLIAIGLAFMTFPVEFDPNVWSINAAIRLMPFFVTGYFYGKYSQQLHEYLRLILPAAVIAVIALTVIELPGGLAGRFLDLTVSLAMITVCIVCAGWLPLLKRLAPYAFFIYLWHVLGTSTMRRALQFLDVEGLPIFVVAGMCAGVFLPIIAFHVVGYLPFARYIRGK
ncbi:MAG: AMP-binding protein [Pseudomonadota bacterium]